MQTRGHTLANGQVLIIREAVEDDAAHALAFAEATAHESDFLSFGPGEFGHTEAQERAFIRACAGSPNRLFIIGLIDDALVSLLHFTPGDRPRQRHTGELGLSVRRPYWGMGIASLMLETLVGWAQQGGVVTKINLRVRHDHARAIAIYERQGFVTEGTITRAVRVGGRYYDHVWMGLEL
jgi:RimJ/RimL family protein N-acetyltransferase